MANCIAIIGRPNVGKSTLFNRLIGERTAIVFDLPGVTRDRIYGVGSWLTREFQVIDTGGIAKNKEIFQEKIAIQAQIAIEEAEVIIFVVDGKTGPVEDDFYIASLLHKSGKKIVLAINKIDSHELIAENYQFAKLGFKDYFFISCTHGINTGDLLDHAVKMLSPVEQAENNEEIKISFIGRPNVGKSQLLNTILDQERVIVSEVEGTTRDAIDIRFQWQDDTFLLVDTAGLKRRGQIYEAIDKFSAMRTFSAIDRSDICFLLIDAAVGFIEQDKHVLSYALEKGKGVIIVVNKWDLVNLDKNKFRDHIYAVLPAIEHLPIVFISALTKAGVHQLFPLAKEVYRSYHLKVATSTINELLIDLQALIPAPSFNGGSLRIYYGTQEGVAPPRITFFVNDPKYLHFSYQRHLENRIRETYGFEGVPLLLKFRKRM